MGMNLNRNRITAGILMTALPMTLLGGLLVAACGMVPPPEYNVVAEATDLEVGLTGRENPADAGPQDDADGGQPSELGMLQLGIGLNTIPALALSDLLGKTRESIEIILSPVEGATREERKELKAQEKLGWVRYTRNMKIRFSEDEFAIELVQEVPDDLNCRQAAFWMGFAKAKAPAEKDGICTWARGQLGDGLNGKLESKGHMFSAVLEDVPMPDDDEKKPLPTAD